MSDRAYLCISVCMLMCATAADGPEALAVRGAAAIPGTRLPRGVYVEVSSQNSNSRAVFEFCNGVGSFVTASRYHSDITVI